MSSYLPSSSSAAQANAANNGMNTLQRSTVNNAAADALRKKMQQLRDELEQVKDDLERSRKELEKERHGRELVRSIGLRCATFHLLFRFIQAETDVSQLTRKLHSFEEQLERTEERLVQTTTKLDEASHAADERERFVGLLTVRPHSNLLRSLGQERRSKIN